MSQVQDDLALIDKLREASNDDLLDGLGQMHGLYQAVGRTLLDFIAVADERELWRGDGAASMAEWLCLRYGSNHATASEWVRVARALKDLPRMAEAYGTGKLSWDKLRALIKVGTPNNEAALLDDSAGLDAARIATLARRMRTLSNEESNRSHRERHLVVRRDPESGWTKLWGGLPDEQGALVAAVLEHLAEDAPKNPGTGFYDPYDARQADALVALADAYLAGRQAAGCALPTVVVHTDADVLLGADGVAEMQDSTALSRETAARLTCDSIVELVFDGRDGSELGVSHRRRTAPPWLRRRVMERDVGCRFPGCHRTARVQMHHIVRWPKGPTDGPNLVALCPYHHRLVHEGGWKIRGDPRDFLEFVSPTGKVVDSHPPELTAEAKERLLGPLLRARKTSADRLTT